MRGAIYYAYTPNAPKPAAKLIVYLTRGWSREPNTLLYSFEKEFPIPTAEWDDLDVGGIARFKRLEPLKRWQIGFHDGKRLDIDLEVDLRRQLALDRQLYETPKLPRR
jgi:hypothetical protein